ncbi:hypothetical protein BaRGS_00020290 [Batillaria attramentaria]|uniref:Uncharacterized protein n=1 Tax=Batillaria attramentaria TaxID=370345 RepID=A0ABD0KMQ9_9CAEN
MIHQRFGLRWVKIHMELFKCSHTQVLPARRMTKRQRTLNAAVLADQRYRRHKHKMANSVNAAAEIFEATNTLRWPESDCYGSRLVITHYRCFQTCSAQPSLWSDKTTRQDDLMPLCPGAVFFFFFNDPQAWNWLLGEELRDAKHTRRSPQDDVTLFSTYPSMTLS